MTVIAVVGAQWGDEGKAKVVDIYTARSEVVARWGGGANAGHTLIVDGKKVVVHLVPASVFRPGVLNIIGKYLVIDPEVLVDELTNVAPRGARIMVDRRATVVLPLYKQLDEARELASGKAAIGTTRRGIGPAYEQKAARRGVNMEDMLSADRFRKAVEARHHYTELSLLLRQHGVEPTSIEELETWRVQYAKRITPYLGDTVHALHRAIKDGRRILFEGAHGILLDVENGSWPYVTSSLCGGGAVTAVTGIRPNTTVGIAKAYLTRVGGGPFPTEQDNDVGAELRERGVEFGSTTGRPRRCGWLDLPALRYACMVGGIDELAITKLDVLSRLKDIPVCIGYEGLDNEYDPFPIDALNQVTPIYQNMPGWECDISDCRQTADLPYAAREYISAIQEYTGLRVTSIGVGPGPEAIIWRG